MIRNDFYTEKSTTISDCYGLDLLNFYVAHAEGDISDREYLLIGLLKASKRYSLKEAGRILADAEERKDAFSGTQVSADIKRMIRKAVFRITSVHRNNGEEPQQCLIDLKLSVRTFKCLVRHGVLTREALVALSDVDLLKIRNFNRSCAEEVRKALSENTQST